MKPRYLYGLVKDFVFSIAIASLLYLLILRFFAPEKDVAVQYSRYLVYGSWIVMILFSLKSIRSFFQQAEVTWYYGFGFAFGTSTDLTERYFLLPFVILTWVKKKPLHYPPVK